MVVVCDIDARGFWQRCGAVLCHCGLPAVPGLWEIALVGMTSISLLLHVCESCAVHDCAQDTVSMCVHL